MGAAAKPGFDGVKPLESEPRMLRLAIEAILGSTVRLHAEGTADRLATLLGGHLEITGRHGTGNCATLTL